MDDQYLNQNSFIPFDEAHRPSKAQRKILFVVESSNPFSGLGNHSSVEKINALANVRPTPL